MLTPPTKGSLEIEITDSIVTDKQASSVGPIVEVVAGQLSHQIDATSRLALPTRPVATPEIDISGDQVVAPLKLVLPSDYDRTIVAPSRIDLAKTNQHRTLPKEVVVCAQDDPHILPNRQADRRGSPRIDIHRPMLEVDVIDTAIKENRLANDRLLIQLHQKFHLSRRAA